MGDPAEFLLGLDKQRRFTARETFVTTNIVEMKGYKRNGRKDLFRKTDLPQYGFTLQAERKTRHGATNTTDR